MSNFAEIIVKELLDDEYFVNDCKKELNEIMKDGKFDTNDLPGVSPIDHATRLGKILSLEESQSPCAVTKSTTRV